MSQDELAEKLEVTRQSISLWETGQTQPSLDNIVALAKLFHVSVDDLLVKGEPETASAEERDTEEKSTSYAVLPKKKSSSLPVILVGAILVVALLAFAWLWESGRIGPKGDDDESSTEPTVSSTPSTVPEKDTDIYDYLKDFVIEKGILNGDYCYYSDWADRYGGLSDERFSLYYWGDTDTIEFCLHSTLNDTFSINFYLYIPKRHTGNYEYTSSYYYRDTGEPLYEAKGVIRASDFTKNYPLNCTKYTGSTDFQNDFMEMSRQGLCDMLDCLKMFTEIEGLKYSFHDLGFTKF